MTSELNQQPSDPLDSAMTMTGTPQPASDPKLRPVVPSDAMPPALLVAIYPYDQLTRDKIHMTWARLSQASREEYIEFVNRRFAWPSQRRRGQIAAAHLAKLN
jgi:hypothetical protein